MVKSRTKQLLSILNSPDPKALQLLRGPYGQKTLAKLLAVSPQAVTDWETGRAVPTPDNLRGLLMHFTGWTTELGWPGLELLCDAGALQGFWTTTDKKEVPQK